MSSTVIIPVFMRLCKQPDGTYDAVDAEQLEVQADAIARWLADQFNIIV